ncbi:unnamed protein product [marine sediment metagenome]|uniref:Uncharacterized protein n=1 Tax=marine sediment metagenome TaxID=412755 RepID=X0ZT02_9ZZZZ
MGKCPRCKWTGSAKAFQRHFASKHFKSKKPVGKKKVFKTPGFAKRRK